jgi:predicted transcriptional regulator
MTYKTGSISEFMTWTKRVITNPVTSNETPQRWFDSDATAAQASRTTTSPEAMVKLLSEDNISLLRMIISEHPTSLRALALMAHRKESNLSRTLKKLHDAGIVDYEEGPGRTRAPRVTAQRVTLELDFVGRGSSVYVEHAQAFAG